MVQTPIGAKSNPWIVYMKECRAHYNEMKSANDLTNKVPFQKSDPVEARKAAVVGPKAKRNETKEETNVTNESNETKLPNKKRAKANAKDSTLEAFLPRIAMAYGV